MLFITFQGWAVISVISTLGFIYLCVCASAECVHTCVSEADGGTEPPHKPECPTLAVPLFGCWDFILTSHSNDYITQICADNHSRGQSAKNRGSKFHLHTLPLKNLLNHSVS